MIRQGFTLMEVLVSLAVMGILLVGAYSVIQSSASITRYSRERLFLIDKGYERVLKHLHYPRTSQPDEEEDGNFVYSFSYRQSNTPVPTVVSVKMEVRGKITGVRYEYFARTK